MLVLLQLHILLLFPKAVLAVLAVAVLWQIPPRQAALAAQETRRLQVLLKVSLAVTRFMAPAHLTLAVAGAHLL